MPASITTQAARIVIRLFERTSRMQR